MSEDIISVLHMSEDIFYEFCICKGILFNVWYRLEDIVLDMSEDVCILHMSEYIIDECLAC